MTNTLILNWTDIILSFIRNPLESRSLLPRNALSFPRVFLSSCFTYSYYLLYACFRITAGSSSRGFYACRRDDCVRQGIPGGTQACFSFMLEGARLFFLYSVFNKFYGKKRTAVPAIWSSETSAQCGWGTTLAEFARVAGQKLAHHSQKVLLHKAVMPASAVVGVGLAALAYGETVAQRPRQAEIEFLQKKVNTLEARTSFLENGAVKSLESLDKTTKSILNELKENVYNKKAWSQNDEIVVTEGKNNPYGKMDCSYPGQLDGLCLEKLSTLQGTFVLFTITCAFFACLLGLFYCKNSSKVTSHTLWSSQTSSRASFNLLATFLVVLATVLGFAVFLQGLLKKEPLISVCGIGFTCSGVVWGLLRQDNATQTAVGNKIQSALSDDCVLSTRAFKADPVLHNHLQTYSSGTLFVCVFITLVFCATLLFFVGVYEKERELTFYGVILLAATFVLYRAWSAQQLGSLFVKVLQQTLALKVKQNALPANIEEFEENFARGPFRHIDNIATDKLDAAVPGQLNFQTPATEIMEKIVDLHHDLMFFITVIVVFVSWMLGRLLYFYRVENTETPRVAFAHHTLLEKIDNWPYVFFFICATRNPSLGKQLFIYTILGFALTETIAIFGLMMVFLILFGF